MLQRFRFLSSSVARNCWSFLPRVEAAPPRETRVPPPPLPSPKYLEIRGHCTLEYVDIPQRQDHETPMTVVLVHGAPGSYSDFRYLIPVLRHHPRLRIIGINLPGYAGSTVAKEHYLESISALPAAELALEAVTTLCRASDNVFLVGHSFGAHTVINMAALTKHNNALNVRGMALLAPAGCRPHKVLRPRESAVVVNLLRRDNPFISAVSPHFIKAVYTMLLKFPSDSPPGHYIAGLVRAGTTDFNIIRDQVDRLRSAKLPSLVAWSQNDEFMEEEIPQELAQLCHSGPRLAFSGGGHNVQKTRAEEIAEEMNKWMQSVLHGEEAEMQTTKYLR